MVGMIPGRLGRRLGHVGPALGLPVVAVARAVVNPGGGIHPNLPGRHLEPLP